MSNFIVISLNDRLNWIVDAIKENLPNNPETVTNFSYGKIKKEKDGYSYEYLSYNSLDNSYKTIYESDTAANLFNNQIGHFITVSNQGDNLLNIFCLDNPLTNEDFKEAEWLLNELKSLYTDKKQTNFQIIRIVFSYNPENPKNLSIEPPSEILKNILKIQHEVSDLRIRTLYIDSQNIIGGAIATDKKSHDLLIPRMLTDFMMLFSSFNDRYNISAAINSDIFTLGYSESAFYELDINLFIEKAHKKLLLEKILKEFKGDHELDYDKQPFGISNKVDLLKKNYRDIPFDCDINEVPESSDKKINDIIIKLKYYIESYLESKKQVLNNLDTELFNNEKKIAENINIKTEGSDLSDVNFIDRKGIFEKYQMEKDNLLEEDINSINEVCHKEINNYKHIIEIIKSKEFNEYLKNKIEKKEQTIQTQTKINSELESRPGCNIFGFFNRKNRKDPLHKNTPNLYDEIIDYKKLRKEFRELLLNKSKYKRLVEKEEEIKNEISKLDSELDNFKLTHHNNTITNLIDLKKLKNYHNNNYKLDKVIEEWEKLNIENKDFNHLMNEILPSIIQKDLEKLKYIKWNSPFSFIKQIDLQKEVEELKNKSYPFIRIYHPTTTALNLITCVLYTDNSDWENEINQKELIIKDIGKVSASLTSHIESKICMFQFMQLPQEVISGIVDSMTKSNDDNR